MPTVKLWKLLCVVYDTDSLLKEFSSLEFVTTIEVTNMRRYSGKANKVRHTCIYNIRGTQRDIAIKEELIIYKSKSSRLSYIFVETVSL